MKHLYKNYWRKILFFFFSSQPSTGCKSVRKEFAHLSQDLKTEDIESQVGLTRLTELTSALEEHTSRVDSLLLASRYNVNPLTDL